jgi:hypothetical protein
MRSLLFLLPLLAACAKEPSKPAAKPAAPGMERFVLASDPGTALPVVEAKKAAPSESAVVVGRIRAIASGQAVIQLTDDSLDYCGRGKDPMDNCPTPWDYCCLDQGDVKEKTLVVEIRGGDGAPLQTPSLPELQLLDLVAVKGKLSKDANGNVLLVAEGYFRRERPKLGDQVVWPE